MSSNGTRPERAEGKRLPASSRIAALAPNGAGFESSRYLGKWLLLGTAIGIVAGLGAVVFYPRDRARHPAAARRYRRLPSAAAVGEGAR